MVNDTALPPFHPFPFLGRYTMHGAQKRLRQFTESSNFVEPMCNNTKTTSFRCKCYVMLIRKDRKMEIGKHDWRSISTPKFLDLRSSQKSSRSIFFTAMSIPISNTGLQQFWTPRANLDPTWNDKKKKKNETGSLISGGQLLTNLFDTMVDTHCVRDE